MGGLVAAWAVGEGIIVYRAIKAGGPPMPGRLLGASVIFIMLALLAESDTAKPLATTLAWGFDVAAFMNLWPTVTGGAATSTTPAATTAPSGIATA